MTVSSNGATLEFYDRIQDRCAEIAALPPSQHEAEIKRLSIECSPALGQPLLVAIVERYAHHRVPDYAVLAKRLIEQLGPLRVRAMLATNHGMRDLKQAVQRALTDEGLSVTGPRVSAFVGAIDAASYP